MDLGGGTHRRDDKDLRASEPTAGVRGREGGREAAAAAKEEVGEPCSCSCSCAMHGPLRQAKRRSEKKSVCGWRPPSETSPCCHRESGFSPV